MNKIISYGELLLIDDRNIKYIIESTGEHNLIYFKVKLNNDKNLICGPIVRNTKEHEQVIIKAKRIKNQFRKNDNVRVIRTSKGTIKNYSTNKYKKTKVVKNNKINFVALGLAAAIGFGGHAYLAKNNITVTDIIGKTFNVVMDKMDEARLAGTMTDARLHEYYSDNPTEKGAKVFFEYEQEKGRSR